MAEKIKVGIWGLGRAGRGMHMTELKHFPDLFEVVAACDLNEGQIEKAKKEWPDARYYTDPEEFLKDPDTELVTVATYSPDHVNHAIAAYKAGKKVVCEKPVSGEVSEIQKLADIEAKDPGSIFIRHNRRFEPAFNHAKELIASGKLGRVYEIKLCRHSYQFRSDWQTVLSRGGGQLLNWGPHLVDQALQFLDYKVKDMWCDLKLLTAQGDAEDQIKVVFRGENGLLVDVEISGGVAIPSPIYAIYGTRGALVSYDELRWKMKYLHPAMKDPKLEPNLGIPDGFSMKVEPVWVQDDIQVSSPKNEELWSIWKYVYESIREHKPYPILMEQAVAVVRAIEEIKKQAINDCRTNR